MAYQVLDHVFAHACELQTQGDRTLLEEICREEYMTENLAGWDLLYRTRMDALAAWADLSGTVGGTLF